MVGWHHQLNGHEFEQAPGDSEGQGSLACCSPRGCKELDMTEQLNKNKKRSLKKKLSLCFFGCAGSSLLCIGFSTCKERELFFVVVGGLLTAAASLVVEHGL